MKVHLCNVKSVCIVRVWKVINPWVQPAISGDINGLVALKAVQQKPDEAEQGDVDNYQTENYIAFERVVLLYWK